MGGLDLSGILKANKTSPLCNSTVASATLPAKGIWVSTLLLGIDLLKLV